MDLGISGRTAAVAAASAGLGFGTAVALAEAGVRVAICGRSADAVEEAVARLGGDAVGLVADVSTAAGAAAWVKNATAALGHIDILVANAGGPKPGTFASTPVDAYPEALELSLLSTVAMVHEAVPAMRERRWGRVLAITSFSVRQPIPTLILSNTARAGVTGFLKTVALEVAADGVTVNTLQPGAHLTDRLRSLGEADQAAMAAAVPAGVLGDPADFGKIAAFLCSDAAKFITGASLQVDGGATRGLQ
jgi:3-oxoacyl-[acyl-carrier protein] reductase